MSDGKYKSKKDNEDDDDQQEINAAIVKEIYVLQDFHTIFKIMHGVEVLKGTWDIEIEC